MFALPVLRAAARPACGLVRSVVIPGGGGIPAARVASFATTTPSLLRQMPTRPKPPPEEDIEEFFLKGSGPGGQKIVCHLQAGTALELSGMAWY